MKCPRCGYKPDLSPGAINRCPNWAKCMFEWMEPMGTNKQWSNDFYRTLEDYEYNVIDNDQFRGQLTRLGFPVGYIDWLIYMMTREVPNG